MATITISTAYAARVTDLISNSTDMPTVSPPNSGTSTQLNNFMQIFSSSINDGDTTNGPSFGSILHYYLSTFTPSGAAAYSALPTSGNILFKNASNQTLTSYLTSDVTRSIDAQGYLVLSNFPPKIPVLAGTISTIIIEASSSRQITLTVGAPAGSADVQFADRDLVTTQPWRLDGSIRFRVPVSYDYTT